MLPPCSMFVLIASLLVACAVRDSAGQAPASSPPQYIISSKSPVTANLDTRSGRKAVNALHNLLESLGGAIDAGVSASTPLACNLRTVLWLESAEAFISEAELSSLDDTCRTRLDGSIAALSGHLEQSVIAEAATVIRGATQVFGSAVAKYVSDSDETWGEVDWSQALPVRGWDIRRGNQRCSVESTVGLRYRNVWYMRAVGTNLPVDAFGPEGSRAFIEEYIRRDLGPALPFPRRKWGDESDTKVKGTTMLTLTGGKAEFASVPMGIDENPALVEALRLNEGAVDQARDAITFSNIAILALPMAMSLIPVSFVADLNTIATLLYILLTDVLSCLPFLIKGVELVSSGTVERGDLVAYHIGTPELGMLEAWAASCQGDDEFRVLGYAFIGIALAIMILGMGLEVYATRVMKKRRVARRGRKLMRGESIGPLGDALLVQSRPDNMGDDTDEVGEVFDSSGASIWRWGGGFATLFGRRRGMAEARRPGDDEGFPGEDGAEGRARGWWWSRRRGTRGVPAIARERMEWEREVGVHGDGGN